MSFIEGIGDEVTAFAVVLLVLFLSAVITFILNSTPFTENRHISQAAVPVPSLINEIPEHIVSEGGGEPTEEPDASRSNDTTCTADNQYEEVNEDLNKNEPVNIDKETLSEDVKHSHIYPNVNDIPSTSTVEEVNEAEESTTAETGEIHIRLKYLDDTERNVQSHPTVQIGDFKRTHFAEDLASNKIVRLIFSGQLLQDNATLQFYGVANNTVIHVQILQAEVQQNPPVSQNADLDLSHLLWPLFSVILGICWILYFKYPDFFNVISLGILFLFTGSFIYFYSQVEHR